MNYTTILFDLDGTITNSATGIINSVKYALKKLNCPIPEKRELYSFIGPPLMESFIQLCKLTEGQADVATSYYREYYQEKGIYQNEVYSEIPELLQSINVVGCELYIATSKPEIYAEKIINHFNLGKYFKGVYGASMDGKRAKKADVIAYALNSLKLEKTVQTVMVGDRSHDVIGGKANNLDTIGVLYGFGSKEELEKAGVTHLVTTPKEIKKIIY